jgi:hypothetical protein
MCVLSLTLLATSLTLCSSDRRKQLVGLQAQPPMMRFRDCIHESHQMNHESTFLAFSSHHSASPIVSMKQQSFRFSNENADSTKLIF